MAKWFKKIFLVDVSRENSVNILIWIYGPVGYFISYFVINNLIMISKITVVNCVLLAIMIAYFSWHIYQLRKCSVIKKRESKNSQKTVNISHYGLARSFFRKFFLQESITKSNPILVAILIDLYFMVNNVNYFLVNTNHL